MFTSWQKRRGVETPPAKLHPLRSGNVEALLDESTGWVRQIRYADHPVLCSVYAAVRDHNWDTVQPRLEDLVIQNRDDSVNVDFEAICQTPHIDFSWRGQIELLPNGLVYRFHGCAENEFDRNRIGFCVLHTVECVGKRCEVERGDGSLSAFVFPETIAAGLLARDVRSIRHEFAPGMSVKVTLQGDTFEMEDQRNWTDASFKTYGTPHDLPLPVRLVPGATVEQEVRLDFSVTRRLAVSTAVRSAAPVRLTCKTSRQDLPVPALGLGASSATESLAARELDRLQSLGLEHVRYDLKMDRDWQHQLARAQRESQQLNVGCELAVMVGDQAAAELAALRERAAVLRVKVARWLILDRRHQAVSARWLQLAREWFQDFAAPVGSGTNANFAELNHKRPTTDVCEFVAYSVNPQVHAWDDHSLLETLAVQRTTVESARVFAGGLPVIVTPITFRPRFNPNATGPQPLAPADQLPAQVDPRQMSLFGAVWTLASLASLIQGGAASVTYYETVGWRGVMETEVGSGSAQFAAQAGQLFPLYHVLRHVGACRRASGSAFTVALSDPKRVCGLGLRIGNRTQIMLGNLTLDTQTVELELVEMRDAADCSPEFWTLDETTYDALCLSPDALQDTAQADVPRPAGEQEIRARDPLLRSLTADSTGRFQVCLRPYALAFIELPG